MHKILSNVLRALVNAAGGNVYIPKGVTIDADFLGCSEPFTVYRVFIPQGMTPEAGDICLGMNGGIPVTIDDIQEYDLRRLIQKIQKK